MPVRRLTGNEVPQQEHQPHELLPETHLRWLDGALSRPKRQRFRDAGAILGDPRAIEWSAGYIRLKDGLVFGLKANWSLEHDTMLNVEFDIEKWYVAEQYPVLFKQSAPITWRGILIYPPDVAEMMGVENEMVSFTWQLYATQLTNKLQRAFRISIGGTYANRGRPTNW